MIVSPVPVPDIEISSSTPSMGLVRFMVALYTVITMEKKKPEPR